jgi:hypothetical protein
MQAVANVMHVPGRWFCRTVANYPILVDMLYGIALRLVVAKVKIRLNLIILVVHGHISKT